jgi:hypothetical protein
MPALVLLPPLPPEEVARGQQCFEWLDIVVVVGEAKSRRRTAGQRAKRGDRRGGPERFGGRYQYVIPRTSAPAAPVLRDRRLEGTALKKREREKMFDDVRELTAAGVYDHRPVRGNGISGDCPTGPCPWVGCRFNTFITVRPSGAVKMNFPGKEIDEVGETCALRIAAAQAGKDEPMPFEEIGPAMGMTDSRAEQIFAGAMVKIRRAGGLKAWEAEPARRPKEHGTDEDDAGI